MRHKKHDHSSTSSPVSVQASSWPELFETVALQVSRQFIDPADTPPALREKIALEAKTIEALLTEWATRVLELLRDNHIVASQFKIDLKIDANHPPSLTAEVLGELLDVQRHELKRDLALARCEKVRLSQSGEKYVAEIVLA